MTFWLQRLEVEHFAGIESASVEFDRGLNICFGPNELGKSTLVKAIRSALLLQHTSSAAEELFDWHADAAPVVRLTFESEPQRIWRVRKSFGAGRDGYSYLEFSRDGQTFTQEAKGREVDGRLQELLQWGIEAPGGKGRRKRGVPESFITTALLGEQADVTAILERALDDDPDDSGKRRLTEALQAMAEDPQFRKVLETAQSRVDEAYTATGRRKSGRGSPWVQLRDQLQAAKDRQDEVNRQREESESARVRIEELQQALLEAQSHAADADRHKQRINDNLEKQHALDQATDQLAAQHELERIQALQKAVEQTEAEIAAKREEQTSLEAEQANLQRAATEAQSHFDAAQTRVRELESGDAEAKRRIREQELQNRVLTLEATEAELTSRIELGERVQEKATRAEALNADIAELETQLEQANEVLTTAKASFEQDEQRLADLNAELTGRRLVAARNRVLELQKAADSAASHRAESKRLTQAVQTLRDELEAKHVPTDETIAALRELETELRVAEEKLQVGLTAQIVPLDKVSVDVAVDGGKTETREIDRDGQVFEAKGELTIDVPGFGRIRLQGGTKDLADTANETRVRWESESSPVFEATGCSTIAELESLRQSANAREVEAQDLGRQAEAALERAERESDNADDIEQANAEVERFEASLEVLIENADDRSALLESVSTDDTRTESAIEEDIQGLQSTLSNRRQIAADLDAQVSGDGGRLERLRSELETIERERATLLENAEDEWADEIAAARDKLTDIEAEKSEVDQQLAEVQIEATDQVDEARRVLEEARAAVESADQFAKDGEGEVANVTTAIAQLEGELKIQRETAEAEDDTAVTASVAEAETELEALPEPDEDVDQDALIEADRTATAAAAEVTRLQFEVREAEGALGQTGGQYIEEQAEQAREAVAAAAAKEHEVDVDYGAWSLLRDTLQEAESEDGAHLGNALVDPVSERMSALTSGRYGRVDIEPQLQTSGIELGGEKREYDALSIGTQEQLATLLRLSIAEALDTFIVMDDQLTQSDADRIERVLGILRRAAEDVQVIVFTCRPDDYSEDSGPKAHVVDLAGRIRRVGLRSGSLGETAEAQQRTAVDDFDGPEAVKAPQPVDRPATSPAKRAVARSGGSSAEGPGSPRSRTSDLAAALRDSLRREAEDSEDGT